MRACQPSRDGYVERDGVKLHYEVYGSGEPTVFLLPTWSIMHSRHWKMQIPYLARHCRVVTFDGRGNGRSDRPTEPEAYRRARVRRRRPGRHGRHRHRARGADRGHLDGRASEALLLAAHHPERVEGPCSSARPCRWAAASPGRAHAYSFEDELDTTEGWAKHNQHYWPEHYRGFLEFFMSRMFTEPHSTKPIEDGVGWGLETDPGDAGR